MNNKVRCSGKNPEYFYIEKFNLHIINKTNGNDLIQSWKMNNWKNLTLAKLSVWVYNTNKRSIYTEECKMLYTMNEDIMEKLKILSDAAKYDVACTSSGG